MARKVLTGVMKEGESRRCRGVPAKLPEPWLVRALLKPLNMAPAT